MSEQQLRRMLDASASRIPVGPAPVAAIGQLAGERRTRRRRWVASATGAVVASVGSLTVFVVTQDESHQSVESGAQTEVEADRVAATGDEPCRSDAPKSDATAYVRTKTCYPTEDEAKAISSSLAGLSGGHVLSMTLGPPPIGFDTATPWLYATVDGGGTSSEDGSRARLDWEVSIAQGAIAERMAGSTVNLRDVIADGLVTYQLAAGSSEEAEDPIGSGDIRAGQVFEAQTEGTSDATIRSDIEAVLTSFGLEPDSIDVFRPLGPAVAVVATVPDTEDLTDNYTNLTQAILSAPSLRYEGLYLELDSPDGTPLVRSATAYRTGRGSVWFAPGMEDLLGIPHSGYAPNVGNNGAVDRSNDHSPAT